MAKGLFLAYSGNYEAWVVLGQHEHLEGEGRGSLGRHRSNETSWLDERKPEIAEEIRRLQQDKTRFANERDNLLDAVAPRLLTQGR